jgi:hypothetical protein
VADNITTQSATLATPPAATVIATDDVAGTHYQRVKLVDGTLDSSAAAGVVGGPLWVRLSDGAAAYVGQKVMANSLPVVVASDQSAIPVSGAFFQATQPVSGPLTDTQLRASAVPVSMATQAPDVTDRAARLLGVVSGAANVFHVDDNAGSLTIDAPVGTPAFVRLSDGAAALIGQKAMAASVPVAIASDQSVMPAVAEQRASTLHVTATGLVNTAVTATLAAAGAGLFHYITAIQIVKLYSVVGIAAGAGNIITSTNLPGNPAWTTEQLASVAGTAVTVLDYSPATPLKSSVANTATTIVCPIQLQTIWRVNVSYFTAV